MRVKSKVKVRFFSVKFCKKVERKSHFLKLQLLINTFHIALFFTLMHHVIDRVIFN